MPQGDEEPPGRCEARDSIRQSAHQLPTRTLAYLRGGLVLQIDVDVELGEPALVAGESLSKRPDGSVSSGPRGVDVQGRHALGLVHGHWAVEARLSRADRHRTTVRGVGLVEHRQ